MTGTIDQNLEDNGPNSIGSLPDPPSSQYDSQTIVPIGSPNMRESGRNRLTRGARKVQGAVKRLAARARSGVQRVVVGGAERKYRPQRQTQSEY